MLALVAERTKNKDLEGAAETLDNALAELDRQEAEQLKTARRSPVAVLEAAVRQHTLRRDAVAVEQRIEMLVAIDHPNERVAWLPEFRERYDAFNHEGEDGSLVMSI